MTTVSFDSFVKQAGGKKDDIQVLNRENIVVPKEENKLKSFGVGLLKGAGETTIGTAKMLQGLGQRTIAGVESAVDPNKTFSQSLEKVRSETGFKSLAGSQAEEISKQLEAKNTPERVGKVTETVAEFLIPFAKTEKVASGVNKTVSTIKSTGTKISESSSGASSKIAKVILGETDAGIVKSAQNPVVKLFKEGKLKVNDVVKGVEESITKFETQSKKALQAVKNAIPDIQLRPQQVAERVNQGIMNSIQHSADYRGIKQGFETVDDIINSGILKPEESDRIKKVVEFIGKWKDTSARGTLNLKEALSNFYATGENYTGSNAVIRSIQRNLVDLVGETAPEIKGALKIASKNIDKTEEFIKHLFGKDSVSGESKILSLARNIEDKARNGYKVDLVKELEKLTGVKTLEGLQGIYDYLQSSKLKAPGLQQPVETLKYLVKKGIEKKIPLK